jgi:hypothetical protein
MPLTHKCTAKCHLSLLCVAHHIVIGLNYAQPCIQTITKFKLCSAPQQMPGVDFMIIIFCDFRQFSKEKLAFFSQNNVKIIFLPKLAIIWVKNDNNFANFFDKNIFKIMTSAPAHFKAL